MSSPSLPPAAQMMQFITGFWTYHILVAAARLGIADRLGAGPRTADELASEVGARPDYLYRLLRAAASVGVFSEDDEGRFSNTPLSEVLHSDHRPSLRYMFMSMADPWSSDGWKTLVDSITTGRTAFERLQGTHGWEYFTENPELADTFNRAMTNLSTVESPAVARAYDFSGIQSVCDVAGGHGLLLATILEANPHVRGTLVDQAHVTDGARNGPLAAHGGRAEVVSGDMFSDVPSGFDAYIMKYIIHDWNDEAALKLLANCRRGINPNGKLLVVDQVVPPGNQFAPSKIMDINMLLFIDGLERTEAQFRDLFASAGWRLTRVIPTESLLCIIEGAPA